MRRFFFILQMRGYQSLKTKLNGVLVPSGLADKLKKINDSGQSMFDEMKEELTHKKDL